MNARLALPLLLAVTLSACVTSKDVSKLDPVFYGSTLRSAEDYVACVGAAWKGLGTEFEKRAIHGGYELIVDGTMGAESVLTASTYRKKTDVRLSSRLPKRAQPLGEAANLCL